MTKHMALLAGAILVSLLAMDLLIARSGEARAAEECLARPGTSSPPGSHWYYRVDRTTHAHCWYLGPAGTKVVSDSVSAPTAKRPTESVLRLPTARPPLVSGETAYASADPIEMAGPKKASEGEAGPSFAMRWLSYSPATVARAPLSIGIGPISPGDPTQAEAAMSSYAVEPSSPSEADGLPMIWPVLADRERAAAQSGPPFALISAILIGALLSMALAMSTTFKHSAARQLAQFRSRIRYGSAGAQAATLTLRRLTLPAVCPRDASPHRYAPRRLRS